VRVNRRANSNPIPIPLNTRNVSTNRNYTYYERFSPDVLTATKKNTQKIEKKTSVTPYLMRTVSEERAAFFQNGTDAQMPF
jgi:hypothetical protein